MSKSRQPLIRGMRDGIPIGLGYFAVAFSLGITARDCGFSALQGFVASITTYASAGQYIGFTLYAAQATLLQLIIMTIIAGLCITDEIFGITIAKQGYIEPVYSFGALIVSAPLWALGTALGITVGNILPAQIVSALSVALFGMFLAVIIPAARHDRIVALVVACSFAASLASRYAPWIKTLSAGNRTILLTLILSSAAALLFPIKDTLNKEEGDTVEH